MTTVEIFGKTIVYDDSKVYGMFNSRGRYGALQVGSTLPRLANAGDKQSFLEFLNSQVGLLKNHLAIEAVVDTFAGDGIIEIITSREASELNRRHQTEIQNTVKLLEDIARTLRP